MIPLCTPKIMTPLRPNRIKQLQWQNMHLSKIITRCKSQHYHDKTSYYLDEHGIAYKKSKMDQIFSMQLWSLKICNPIYIFKIRLSSDLSRNEICSSKNRIIYQTHCSRLFLSTHQLIYVSNSFRVHIVQNWKEYFEKLIKYLKLKKKQNSGNSRW